MTHGDWQILVSPWHLEEHIRQFPLPHRSRVVAGDPDQIGGIAGHLERVARAAAVSQPLMLAGDCLASLGMVAGLQRLHGDVSLVWLDAHGDFNTPEISASGYLAGMSLAMLTGRAPQPFARDLGLRPIPDRAAVLVDARDLDPAERDALEASEVLHVAAEPRAIREALDRLPRRPVYLHVDTDVVDPTDLPGLRFPTPDGPGLRQVEECVAAVADAGPPIGICIAVQSSPDTIADEATTGAIARIAAAAGARLSWPVDDGRSA